jgi:hypothetical protein
MAAINSSPQTEAAHILTNSIVIIPSFLYILTIFLLYIITMSPAFNYLASLVYY